MNSQTGNYMGLVNRRTLLGASALSVPLAAAAGPVVLASALGGAKAPPGAGNCIHFHIAAMKHIVVDFP